MFLVIAILMGEGMYMVSKVLYNSKSHAPLGQALSPALRHYAPWYWLPARASSGRTEHSFA